jgi:RNA ligase
MKHPARTVNFATLHQNLQQEVENGTVYEIQQGDLSLYCYTKRCIYDCLWNEWNILARGLILDRATQQVIATPFPKFFNYGELSQTIPDEAFETYEKFSISYFYTFCLKSFSAFFIQINNSMNLLHSLFSLT